jgi:hypothetical protein
MTTGRTIILLLVTVVVVTTWTPLRGAAQKEKDKENIWVEEELRGPGRGPGPGPGRGPERFELTDEETNRILSSLKQSDPNAVKELEKLRKEDPEKFQAELRRYGREEFGKILRERIENWRHQRQTEFTDWLTKEYPKEAENLAKLKENEPKLYFEKFDLIRNKYWRIFDEEKRNPELAEVLKEDLRLKDKRDDLVIRIKAAKNEKDKKKLLTELEEVVSKRYDLIVRQKEIAYERLLKWLEGLRNRVRESRDEIIKFQNKEVKAENVKKHIKDLTEESTPPPFRWD